jgi:hypothetical protein
VNTALKSYDYAKNNSRVVKFGAEMVESSVKTISKPVINRLPGAVTNRVSRVPCSHSVLPLGCPRLPAAFDRICTQSTSSDPFPAWCYETGHVTPCRSFFPSLALEAVCASGRIVDFTSKATGRHALSLSPHQLFVPSPRQTCRVSSARLRDTGSRQNHRNSHIWKSSIHPHS